MALETLHYCGLSWDEIAREFCKEVKWLLHCGPPQEYTYEEIEVLGEKEDAAGREYHRLRLRHFLLPRLLDLALSLGKKAEGLNLSRKLLASQFTGGWGPSRDELAVWATRQACDALNRMRRSLPDVTFLQRVHSYVLAVPYFAVESLIASVGLAALVFCLLMPGYRQGLVPAIVVAAAPCFFGRR